MHTCACQLCNFSTHEVALLVHSSRTSSMYASVVSWFSEHNAEKLQKGINIIQPLQIFLRELHSSTGLFDILRPRNRTRAALLCTFAALPLLACAQFCHIISKAESIPAMSTRHQALQPGMLTAQYPNAADRHPHDSDSFAKKAYMLCWVLFMHMPTKTMLTQIT